MRNNAIVRQSVSRFGKDELPKRSATEKIIRLEAGTTCARPPESAEVKRVKLRPGLY